MITHRVLQVTGAMNLGGTESMLMNIYRHIDRSKVQFDFLSFSKEEAYFDKEIWELGGRVIYCDRPSSITALVKIIRSGNYQAVHAHTLFQCGVVMTAAKLAAVPIRIAHAHTTSDQADTLPKKIYIYMMQKMILRYATATLTCSKEAGRYMFRNELAEWIPNPIETAPYLERNEEKINNFQQEHRIDHSIVIGHVGRFMKAKNHLFLLHILTALKEEEVEAVLVLVGDGDLKEEIEKEAEKLQISSDIRFTGIMEDPSPAVQTMDVFLFPSIYEGLGLVLLEAQAAGTPCIVSEAIQPEADAGLNLITKVPLQQGITAWTEEIKNLAARGKIKNTQERGNQLKLKGYNLETIAQKFLILYQIEKGGSDEKTADRVI